MLLKIFPINKLPYWIAAIVLVLCIIAFYLIKLLPEHIIKKIEVENEFKNNRNLQIESYYRQISGEETKELFEKWTSVLMEKSEGSDRSVEWFEELLLKTTMYGSKRTIDLLSMYQQRNYAGDITTTEFIAYITEIISSLKYDFSGYKVNPINLAKVKLNDFDNIEPEIIENVNIIESKLNEM